MSRKAQDWFFSTLRLSQEEKEMAEQIGKWLHRDRSNAIRESIRVYHDYLQQKMPKPSLSVKAVDKLGISRKEFATHVDQLITEEIV